MTSEHLKPWQALSPEEAQQWAHSDIDVLLLRRDCVAARFSLADWDGWAADPPGRLRPWPSGEDLPSSVSDAVPQGTGTVRGGFN